MMSATATETARMPRTLLTFALLALASASAAQAAATRTHVSNAGNDANAAFSCDYAHPCRTLAVALANTTPGGEILAIDSSGYGKLVVDRSVSIVAAPGVFAGIGVGAGGNATGVEIATAGVNVVLRGLTLTGQGGTYGIHMSNGSRLSVENCVVSGFASGQGVFVDAPATVRIVDSLFRDNSIGVVLRNGARGSIAGSVFHGNSYDGIAVWAHVAGTTTTADVSDSVVTGSDFGLGVWVTADSAVGRLTVSRSTVSGNGHGIDSEWFSRAGGSATVYLSDTLVSENTIGLYQNGAGATFHSLGNNTVSGNITATSGAIGSTPPM